MELVVGVTRTQLAGLQAVLSTEIATRRGWTGIVDLWCVGPSIHVAAVVGSEVVGVAAICFMSEGFCELHKLYVAPAHRRQDIARRLVSEVERVAHERGWLEIGIQLSGDGESFWEAYLRNRAIELLPERRVIFWADR